MAKSALVYYDGKMAGLITKTEDGYVFEYAQEYVNSPDARPVSLTMPLQKEKFESHILFPFFDGLLPEGWLLNLTSRALKIDKEDKFELLLHIGKDTIGAISIIPKEDDPK